MALHRIAGFTRRRHAESERGLAVFVNSIVLGAITEAPEGSWIARYLALPGCRANPIALRWPWHWNHTALPVWFPKSAQVIRSLVLT
jgi:hypothetical protein